MQPSPSADRRRRCCLAALCLFGSLLTLGTPAAAPSQPTEEAAGRFRILDARTQLVDGVHLLDADIDFAFSPQALEAMENGVSLTITVEMDVLRKRRIKNKRVARVKARYRVETNVLSKQYLIRNLTTGEVRTFASFDEMREALGHIEGFPLLDDHLLDAGHDYVARLRAKLDIEALPSPLRPIAYLSPRWRLKSDWFAWTLAR